jgi:hypothetical protein
VRVFRQDFALEDAIGSHACSLEANMRVTDEFLSEVHCSYRLSSVDTVICVQTLKAYVANKKSFAEWQAHSNFDANSAEGDAPGVSVPHATVRRASLNTIVHSRMPLVPTPARLN